MITEVRDLFCNPKAIKIIRAKLPTLFYEAEKECERKGIVGMEVGLLREKILATMFMSLLGEIVSVDISATEPETDILVSEKNLAVRTFKNGDKVKVGWTADYDLAKYFISTYKPKADILFAYVKWDGDNTLALAPTGRGLYHIPLESAIDIRSELGARYFKPPKKGKNGRGVEYTKNAVELLMNHLSTTYLEIDWIRPTYAHDGYQRWLDRWESE